MQSKGLIGLVLAAAASVIVAVILAGGSQSAVDPQTGTLVLPEIGKRLGEVARVTLVHGPGKTTLLRQGGGWVVEEKSNYPADLGKLRPTLLGLAALRYVEPKTSNSTYYARLEVEDAADKDAKSTLVTVSDGKGDLLGEVIVGKHRIDQLGGGSDGVYLRKPGDPQSWLAGGTLDLAGDTASWLDRKIVDILPEAVKEAVLIQPDGGKLDIARDKPGDPLALKDAPAERKTVSDAALNEPASALTSLLLGDVRPAAALPLPEAGVSHAEFTTFAGLTVKVALFEKDGGQWAYFDASGEGEAAKSAAELEARLAPWVYAIPAAKAAALRTKLADVIAVAKPPS
jgi:hypothetical protein